MDMNMKDPKNTSKLLAESQNDFRMPLFFEKMGKGNWYQIDTNFYNSSNSEDGIPNKLQVLPTDLNDSGELKIISCRKSGFRGLYTNLYKAYFTSWYYGFVPVAHGNRDTENLILINFSPDDSMFRLYIISECCISESDINKQLLTIIPELIRYRLPVKKKQLNTHYLQSSRSFLDPNRQKGQVVGDNSVMREKQDEIKKRTSNEKL